VQGQGRIVSHGQEFFFVPQGTLNTLIELKIISRRLKKVFKLLLKFYFLDFLSGGRKFFEIQELIIKLPVFVLEVLLDRAMNLLGVSLL